MNTNKILVAGLIGGIFAFLFGWLFFGILLKDQMTSHVSGYMRSDSEMIVWAMALSCLLWGMFFAYVFAHWASISTWRTGAKAGAILGFLVGASYDLGMYSMTNHFDLNSMLVDIVLNTFYSALVGLVVGWWLGRQ